MCASSITWEKGFGVFTAIVFVFVAVFLAIDLGYGNGNVAVAVFAVNARGKEVSPGPGDPDGFAIGNLIAHRNMKEIKWNLVYDKIDTITWMRISGPVGGTSSSTGPVLLWLCGGQATQTCDLTIPHRITGTVTEDTAGGLSPRTPIEKMADHPGFYYLEIATNSFPSGALRMQLGATSGPGQW